MSTEAQKGRRVVAVAPGHFRVQQMWLRCPHAHPTPADAKTCDWSNKEGTIMSKITVTLTPEDVATLREVFHLALVQSEAVLDDAEEGTWKKVLLSHHAVISLMARIDAMLPDSTGFFD